MLLKSKADFNVEISNFVPSYKFVALFSKIKSNVNVSTRTISFFYPKAAKFEKRANKASEMDVFFMSKHTKRKKEGMKMENEEFKV